MAEEIIEKTVLDVVIHHLKPAQGSDEPRTIGLNEATVLFESAVPVAASKLVEALAAIEIKIDPAQAAKVVSAILGV